MNWQYHNKEYESKLSLLRVSTYDVNQHQQKHWAMVNMSS